LIAVRRALPALIAVWLVLGAGTTPAAANLRVRGSQLVDGARRGHVVVLRGVNRSGLEYACVQGWGFFDSPRPNAIDTAAMIAAMKSWNIDVVRVPLNEDCWLGVNTRAGRGGPSYRRIVAAYVRALHAAGLYVILDLHLAAPGSTPATAQLPMADRDHAPAFWRSVAATFKSDHALIFDLFNEPFGIGWSCWRDGCRVPAQAGAPAYRTAGMQTLVNAVRSTGATQPLLLGGLDYSAELSGWSPHAPRDSRHQLIAAEHDYGGLSPCSAACRAGILTTARHHPVLLGELGETDCAHGYIDQMMAFADRHGVGYLGWAWDATAPGSWNCSSGPALITAYDGSPTAYGVGLRDHLRALGPASSAAVPALP
jgi:endoglucanase